MRGRAAVVVLALGAAGLLFWRYSRPDPRSSPSLAAAPSLAVPSESAAPVPISASVAAASASSVNEPDAEALLRQLEPLAVTDKPRALQLALDADSKLPPDGVMAQARRALIVTLLVDENRMPEARARARAFTTEYPDSRYLPLVQGVTGVHPRPRPSQLRDAQPAAP